MKTFIKNVCCGAIILLLACVTLFAGCEFNPKNRKLVTNKNEYYSNEEILITAKGNENNWVGVYRLTDDTTSVEAIRWYWVNKNGYVSGTPYSLQRAATYNESRQAFRNFPAGTYKAMLFEGEGENKIIKEMKVFTVKKEKLSAPEAPTDLQYKIYNPESGLANGKVKVYFEDDFMATDVMLYWANEQGVLENYTNLATFRVTSNPVSFEMYDNTIIPKEATKLIAFGVNNAGISTNYAEYSLPTNCGYNLEGNVVSEFNVVSDVHIAIQKTHLASEDAIELHSKHFVKMCNDIVKISPNSDGLFIVGDIANSGRESEWQKAVELAKTVNGLPQVYYSLGNHDLYFGSYNTQAGYFKKYANTDSVYYEKEINGYHHLFLGSESNHKSGVDADLSMAQLNWFDQTLHTLTANEPNKPVFVYLHQSLYNTIAGSFEGQGWDGIMQETEFREIVKKYPQIVMFNGHSHWDLNTRGSMHTKTEELPNIFNTSSVAYLWSSYYMPQGEYLKGSQGYYIKVYEDKILVLGRDFEQGKWIPSACFEAKI